MGINVEAKYYSFVNGKLSCNLCPHNCKIDEGKTGVCGVRRNIGGKLISETYGILSAVNLDPIEKKPLYHFFPGSYILSLGSIGCNMTCKCCQNYNISQVDIYNWSNKDSYNIDKIIRTALSNKNNIGIAYTYNEPTVWFEYMLDTAKKAKKEKLKNVVVSNGYINEKPLEELLTYIDAFNIDLKGFKESFYKNITGAKLEPIKATLKRIAKSKAHLEITNLVIPTLNDDISIFKDMISWISEELGKETVLHLSRYYPTYKMDIDSTDTIIINKLYEISCEKLDYVYPGNIKINDLQDTICPLCKTLLIKRNGYNVENYGINDEGNCLNCKKQVVINR